MKKRIAVVFVISILITFFGSCDLFNQITGNTVTAPERVNQFITGVTTGAWGTLQDHFYGPGEPQDYETMNTGEEYWKNTPIYDADTITVTGDPADTAAAIDATMNIAGNSRDLVFHLKQNPDNKNYYITLIDFVDYANDDDVRFIGL